MALYQTVIYQEGRVILIRVLSRPGRRNNISSPDSSSVGPSAAARLSRIEDRMDRVVIRGESERNRFE